MREILFRGKRIDNGEWVYGYYGLFIDKSDIYVPYTAEEMEKYKGHFVSKIGGLWHTVDLKTIGQYTGLTDSKGKKIFEGDIIRYADIDEYRMYLEALESPQDYEEFVFDIWTIDEVVYGLEVGYPAFDLNKHDWEVNGLSNLNESGQFFYEIIGNIHDNPKLLGGAE